MCLFLFTSLSISIISLKFNLLDRVADYFQVFIIVYLPNVISKISNQKKRIIAIYLVIVMFLYGISIQYLKPEWNKVFPYSFLELELYKYTNLKRYLNEYKRKYIKDIFS